MNSFYQDDQDEFDNAHHSFSPTVMRMIVGVSAGILVILMIVLAVNNRAQRANRYRTASSALATASPKGGTQDLTERYEYDRTGKDIEELYRDGELRAQDLDIWDMYEGGGNVRVARPSATPEIDEDPDRLGPYEVPGSPGPEESPDPDGTPHPEESPGAVPTGEPLLRNVKRNTIDYTKLRIVNDKMTYYVNGEESSFLGVDLSRENGTVNFETLKENGVSFVMLRVGSRGYDSGVISLDENFERNIKAASEAGLNIGLSFSSRAVSIDEAVEEAFFCMEHSEGYTISYPIAYVFEGDVMDSARTDSLDRSERTKVAEAFMNTIRSNNFNTILYGTKDDILNVLDPEKLLPDYDVWLFDTDNMPDYPYQYKLWRYTNSVTVPGVEYRGSYDLSFVDYAGR